MKKYYVAPELEELEIELEGFLCGSKDIVDGGEVDFGGDDDDEDDGL
jgi:hypothetical protein